MAKSAGSRENLLRFLQAINGPIMAIISTGFAQFFLPETGQEFPFKFIPSRSTLRGRSLHWMGVPKMTRPHSWSLPAGDRKLARCPSATNAQKEKKPLSLGEGLKN
jgi:hypothetical protein